MGESKMLTLGNGECIRMENHCAILFEVIHRILILSMSVRRWRTFVSNRSKNSSFLFELFHSFDRIGNNDFSSTMLKKHEFIYVSPFDVCGSAQNKIKVKFMMFRLIWAFSLLLCCSLRLFLLSFFCTLDLPIIRWPTFYGHGYYKSMISVWAIWNGSFVFLLLLLLVYFVCCFFGHRCQYYITMADGAMATTATTATDGVSNITHMAPTGIQLTQTHISTYAHFIRNVWNNINTRQMK